MEVNEGFVVYLFSRFHEHLGFDRITHIGNEFPDCIAEKNGRKVTIEFESDAAFLRNHMKVAAYHNNVYRVHETDEKYIIKNMFGQVIAEYPKSEFEICRYHYVAEILYRNLPLDYCVCWKCSKNTRKKFSNIKIIELRKIPFIIEFLKEKGYWSKDKVE